MAFQTVCSCDEGWSPNVTIVQATATDHRGGKHRHYCTTKSYNALQLPSVAERLVDKLQGWNLLAGLGLLCLLEEDEAVLNLPLGMLLCTEYGILRIHSRYLINHRAMHTCMKERVYLSDVLLQFLVRIEHQHLFRIAY
jgi:hypothetical protein